jgi:sugar/nucleoside kinase (ribokinase family)
MIRIPGGIIVSGNIVIDTLVVPVEKVQFGGTVWVESIEQHLGGNGANTSYALGLLGARVRTVGMVGDDDYGRQALNKLASADVDLGFIQYGRSGTAASVVLVQPGGGRAFLHRPGVSTELFTEPFDFGPDLIDGCSHYHLANPFSLVHLRPRVAEVLQSAQAAGLTTSLDTAWDSKGDWMRIVEPALPHIDLLFVNDDEAEKLTGTREPAEAARRFRAAGAHDIVIKLGAAGCAVFHGGAERRIPPLAVTAVDTTGAGDCFVGGFLAALAHGLEVESAARVANAVGARSVTAVGAVTGLWGWVDTLAWAGLTGTDGKIRA